MKHNLFQCNIFNPPVPVDLPEKNHDGTGVLIGVSENATPIIWGEN